VFGQEGLDLLAEGLGLGAIGRAHAVRLSRQHRTLPAHDPIRVQVPH
jgi:hypothetical protein